MIVEELKKSVLDYLLNGNSILKRNLSKNGVVLDSYPKNWQVVKIGDVIDVARGGSPRPIKSFLTTSDNGVNWIKISDTIKGSKYIDSCKEKITKAGIEKSRLVHKGDFLLTNSMSFGRPYILNVDGCIHDGWLVLTDNNQLFLKDFLFYTLSSNFVYKQFCSKASGAVVSNLNIDKVKDTTIPLPPLEEQQKIVDKIEELFAKLDELKPIEEELELLKKTFPSNMKNSILNKAYTGMLTTQDYSMWHTDKLIDCCSEIVTGNSISETIKKSKYTNIESGYSYIATKDLEFDHIFNYENGVKIPFTEDGFKYANVNDILMCIEGGSTGKKIGLLNEKVCYGNKLCKFSANNNILPKFLYYYLQSPLFLKNFNSNLSGIIGGVSINKIKTIEIKYPPIEEQQRIVDKLEQLLPLCDDIDKLVIGE